MAPLPHGRLLALLLCAALTLTAPPVPASAPAPATAGAAAPAAAHRAPPALTAATARAAAAPPAVRPRRWRTVSARLQVATFNVLGSQHTRGDPRWLPGWRRARLTARIVRTRGVGIVGFQEVQADQLRTLRRHLDGYALWPRDTLGAGARRLQLAWKRSRFQLLETGSITTPFDRTERPIPVVTLRDRRTGAQLTVVVVHNSPRRQERGRDVATRAQLKLVNRLRRASPRAVFLVGDVNERTEFFCRAVRWTELRAADGGSSTRRGCRPPVRPVIDQLYAAGRVEWLRYARSRGSWVRRASDHRFVVATARVSRLVRVRR